MVLFGDFRFDEKQKVLFKFGKPVSLTQKQTELLALFISEPQTIFSKEDILDKVWEGRAVSEQVVFQNISKLRNVIASDAIKTFSKRGYQWQIPFDEEKPSGTPPLPRKKKIWFPYIWGLSLISIIFVFFFSQSDSAEKVFTENINFIPIMERHEGLMTDEVQTINQRLSEIAHTVEADDISAIQFLNSSFIERSKLQLDNDGLLMSGMLRQKTGKYILSYRIQGAYRNWEALVIASSPKELAEAAALQIQRITVSKYFSLEDEALVTSELELLHSENPADIDILISLIGRHLEEENQDVAGAYIDALLGMDEVRKEPAYKAIGFMLKGKRALALSQFVNAEPYLREAAAIASGADLLFIQSEVLKALAEVAISERKYPEIKRLLLEAASLARMAQEPVKEVRAYTLLSIMAGKLAQHQDKYDYLYQAKRLMLDYRFDRSHFMLVDYHFALFSENVEEQKNWYRQALKRPETPENAWVLKSAADNLVELLISEKNWDEAFNVSEQVEHDATSHKLKANIYFGQRNTEKALAEAEAAFNIARVSGDRWVGVYAALMLLEHAVTVGDEIKAAEYRQYFQSNLKGRWKGWRKEQLATLGVS
ncbi:winged helix-turn-helix domain-containing protein [Kordiimonas laminariae]|uniref:winged helix-turn-helix domain-containing protein n=1 Tax=Kordiimonas laminariae TaxID=2917717 RepID=UPI001FF29940|nr:winged helix-turn-helix domain-containing protein [Kordiimonas laminariae]MCK0067955.1 winged helix-turn-helix domain-containing protein [Kordiimonas laminariae]